MRIAPLFALAAVLVLPLAWTPQALSQKTAHKMGHKTPPKKAAATGSAASPALIAAGKTLSSEKKCNTCHSENLAGKPNFAPSLRAAGITQKYNAKTFAVVMDTGVTEDGGKVKAPMPVYHLPAKDSAALYAYFKTLK